MKILKDIFNFIADKVSYSAVVYLSSLLALVISILYGFIFMTYALPLPLDNPDYYFIIKTGVKATAMMLLGVTFILSGWKRLYIPALIPSAKRINRFYDLQRNNGKIENDELISAMHSLILFPQRNMSVSVLSVLFVLVVLGILSGVENISFYGIKTGMAGCGIALYMYALFVYSIGDLATNSLRKKGFEMILKRGMSLPDVYGFSFRKKIILVLGFLLSAVLTMLYLISNTQISINYFLVYFLITALVIILLVLVYVFPLVNVFYHVLSTTGRLSRGEDGFLIVGNNEKEIINFSSLFNRSMNEFSYLRKNLEIKVKERTELLEKRNRELLENEEKFRILSDSAQDAIIMMDNDGNISYWNKASELIFGYRGEEIIGKPLHEILAPRRYEEMFQKKYTDFKRFGKGLALGKRIEFSAVRKSGEEFPVEISLSAFKLDYKWNAVAILRDVTERKDYELEIFKAKQAAESANRAKSEFLANMSHEIRTPMNGILGFSEIIKQDCSDPEIQKKADIIYRSGTGLLELINDILDLSKIEAGRMAVNNKNFDLYELIRQTYLLHSIVAENKGLSFNLRIDESLPRYIISDAKKLQQVITNLLSNAIKFTESGFVNINAETISRYGDEIILKISVEDSGIGIPKKSAETIFESFEQSDASTTRNYEGTGLGLAIARSFVEMLEGHIWVEPEVDRGAHFAFIIKAREGSEEGILPAVYDQGREPNLARFTFLIVDPDENNRILLKYMLEGIAASVSTAETAEGLYDELKKNHVHCLFLDSKIKDEEGRFPSKIIRESDDFMDLRLVGLQSGIPDGRDETQNLQKFDAIIEKPLSRKNLFSVMSEIYPCSDDKSSPCSDREKGMGKEVEAKTADLEKIAEEIQQLSLDRSSERKKALEIIVQVQQAHVYEENRLDRIKDAINNFEYDLAEKLIEELKEGTPGN